MSVTLRQWPSGDLRSTQPSTFKSLQHRLRSRVIATRAAYDDDDDAMPCAIVRSSVVRCDLSFAAD